MKSQKIALCGLLAALALALSVAEKWFPLQLVIPVPGIKLGLANVVTLFALRTLSRRQALAILLCRITLGAVLAGTVTGFLFSLLGGLLAFGTTAVLLRWEGRAFSLCGVSIAAAAAHDVGQIAAAMLWLRTADVLGYLPLLLLTAIPLGIVTGTVCQTALLHLKKFYKFT